MRKPLFSFTFSVPRHRGGVFCACRPCLPVLRVLLLGCGMMAAIGCATVSATASPTAALELEVDAANQVWLGDDSYAIRDLPAALRKRRVPPGQSLRIHTADSGNRALLVRLSSVLRSAGYTRFAFVGDPHAEALVVDPNRTQGGQPKTPGPVR